MRLVDSPLLKPHIGKPAILDSNLLLLFWCAEFDPSLVQRFKRLNSFQESDFHLLSWTLGAFSALRTTPHVLTEISNLTNALPQGIKDDWAEYFSNKVQVISEEWTPAATIVSNPLIWLGLTDAALASLASSHVILTIDFPLSNSLESRGLNVINFTHLRNQWLE
jgi:hypothetical protein